VKVIALQRGAASDRYVCWDVGSAVSLRYFVSVSRRMDRLCGLVVKDPEVRVGLLALPNFLRSSESGTGSTQPREYN
jgi:hypothetical protein